MHFKNYYYKTDPVAFDKIFCARSEHPHVIHNPFWIVCVTRPLMDRMGVTPIPIPLDKKRPSSCTSSSKAKKTWTKKSLNKNMSQVRAVQNFANKVTMFF